MEKWYKVNSVDDLENLGSLDEVKKIVKETIGENISLKQDNWEELFQSISKLKELLNIINNDTNSIYFKSEEAELIYCLLNLDGKERLKKLSITTKHFMNKNIAKQWKIEASKKLHPDICKHPKANDAMAEVNKLYEEMVANG